MSNHLRLIAAGAVVALLSACDAAPDPGFTEKSVGPATSGAQAMPAPSPMMAAPRVAVGMPTLSVSAGSGNKFTEIRPSSWQAVDDRPISTFSLDVDTASYAFVRRSLRDGFKPAIDAVRVEEMVNYFPYNYGPSKSADQPFAVTAQVMPSPWKTGAKLMHIGVKAWDVASDRRPPARLTFLIDVSGSMDSADRLPFVKSALLQLVETLRPDDKVSIVTYAGGAAIRLEPSAGDQAAAIGQAIQSLQAGGGTAGGAGLKMAYDLARRMKQDGAINRVILATDGDFNVGQTDLRGLEGLITDYRKDGIYLTILGVGMGNLNDALMQRLAQTGNGQAFYLDTAQEGRKVWADQLASTMIPIADDVKTQVEFNPATVAEYRLIGYETRALDRADFKDDRIDAGDIGAGQSVTAIYEFLPKGATNGLIEPRKYGSVAKSSGRQSDYATVKLRYKRPGQGKSHPLTVPVRIDRSLSSLASASDDIRFSVAVAGFGQILRGQLDDENWQPMIDLADGARGSDPFGWRTEAVQLMRLAKTLKR